MMKKLMTLLFMGFIVSTSALLGMEGQEETRRLHAQYGEWNETALMRAARHGNVECLNALLPNMEDGQSGDLPGQEFAEVDAEIEDEDFRYTSNPSLFKFLRMISKVLSYFTGDASSNNNNNE